MHLFWLSFKILCKGLLVFTWAKEERKYNTNSFLVLKTWNLALRWERKYIYHSHYLHLQLFAFRMYLPRWFLLIVIHEIFMENELNFTLITHLKCIYIAVVSLVKLVPHVPHLIITFYPKVAVQEMKNWTFYFLSVRQNSHHQEQVETEWDSERFIADKKIQGINVH